MKRLNYEIKYDMCFRVIRQLTTRQRGVETRQVLDGARARAAIHSQVWEQVE